MSGGDFAVAASPMVPAAPGRLSTSTCWPHMRVRRSVMRRAMMSGDPPAGKGTMMRMGFAGNSCAPASVQVIDTAAATAPKSVTSGNASPISGSRIQRSNTATATATHPST